MLYIPLDFIIIFYIVILSKKKLFKDMKISQRMGESIDTKVIYAGIAQLCVETVGQDGQHLSLDDAIAYASYLKTHLNTYLKSAPEEQGQARLKQIYDIVIEYRPQDERVAQAKETIRDIIFADNQLTEQQLSRDCTYYA